MSLVRITRALSRAVDGLHFGPPVTHVYNPLVYARAPHEAFLRRFGRPGIQALLVGMNPGPYGMVQTGIPFGEVAHARDWMGIDVAVERPDREHPRRPIQGFDCTRSEVSGRRLWGWAASRWGTADRFFDDVFVWNFCPLAFLEESGRNRTPDKLPAAEREALEEPCRVALARVVDFLEPTFVVGIGAFAEARARAALAAHASGPAVTFGRVLHPSPASPLANRGWAVQAEAQLQELGVRLPRSGGAAR